MNSIIIVGIVQPEINSGIVHLQDYIYSECGVCPTITARDYKSPREILIGDYKWIPE